MPISKALVARLRPAFATRRRTIVSAVLIVLVGWLFLGVAFLATAIADLVGAVGPGRSIGAPVRVGIGSVATFVILALAAGASPGPAPTPAAQSPEPSAVAAVTATPAATATPPPTAMPTVAPAPTRAPATSPTAAPQPTPAPATPAPAPTLVALRDRARDWVDEDGEPAKGVAWQDIVRTTAAWEDDRLVLTIETADDIRRPADPVSEMVSFDWYLDTDLDGTPDWLLIVENLDEPDAENYPGWGAGLTRMSDGFTFAGPQYPGTLLVDGAVVTVRIPLEEHGDVIGVAALTEHNVYPDIENDPLTSVMRHDHAPNRQWPDGNDWMRVPAR